MLEIPEQWTIIKHPQGRSRKRFRTVRMGTSPQKKNVCLRALPEISLPTCHVKTTVMSYLFQLDTTQLPLTHWLTRSQGVELFPEDTFASKSKRKGKNVNKKTGKGSAAATSKLIHFPQKSWSFQLPASTAGAKGKVKSRKYQERQIESKQINSKGNQILWIFKVVFFINSSWQGQEQWIEYTHSTSLCPFPRINRQQVKRYKTQTRKQTNDKKRHWFWGSTGVTGVVGWPGATGWLLLLPSPRFVRVEAKFRFSDGGRGPTPPGLVTWHLLPLRPLLLPLALPPGLD